MRSISKRLAFGCVIVALAIGAVGVSSIDDPGDLTRPVAVTGATARADGGSMEVHLLGANNKRISVHRQGSLEISRSKQSMHLVSYVFGVVPYRRHVERQSQLAQESRALLESWLNGRLTAEQRSKLLTKDLTPLRDVPVEVAIVFDLANWIAEGK